MSIAGSLTLSSSTPRRHDLGQPERRVPGASEFCAASIRTLSARADPRALAPCRTATRTAEEATTLAATTAEASRSSRSLCRHPYRPVPSPLPDFVSVCHICPVLVCRTCVALHHDSAACSARAARSPLPAANCCSVVWPRAAATLCTLSASCWCECRRCVLVRASCDSAPARRRRSPSAATSTLGAPRLPSRRPPSSPPAAPLRRLARPQPPRPCWP